MVICAVYCCSNSLAPNSDPGIDYYTFPKHPVYMQQWIEACWRADTIDIKNEQVCSIHFDNSSYSSEFEIDSLGHYTRLLKYDAVPTLQLPQFQQVATMEQPIIIDLTEVDVDPNTLSQQRFIPAEVHKPTALIEEFDLQKQKLQSIQTENESLKQNISGVEDTIRALEIQLSEKNDTLSTVNEKLTGLTRDYDIVRRSRMPYSKQKKILSKVFSESQLKRLLGAEKVHWSDDDMAVGYTIHRLSSKRCYEYITKNLNIPLPGLSSIERWAVLDKRETPKKKITEDIQDEQDLTSIKDSCQNETDCIPYDIETIEIKYENEETK